MFQNKEHCDNAKSNCFGYKNIRNIRSKGSPEYDKKIIKPILRIAVGNFHPNNSQRRFIGCIHMWSSTRLKKEAPDTRSIRVYLLRLDIYKTYESKKKTEYKSMGNKMATGKGISKEHPANKLINNIRQYGFNCHIKIIYLTSHLVPNMLNDEKDSKYNPKMTEKEHYGFIRLKPSKMFSIWNNLLFLHGDI